MCLICVEFNKRAMNIPEARRALREMREKLDDDHVRELTKRLDQAEKHEDEAAGKP